uniref:FCD domain-containing protein n=1 Tax=Neorhizobium sp. EC2-8 TaxID=3129230 RepID=UPI003101548F
MNSALRGMVVRSVNEEDVEELYAARLLIEKGAVEAAFDAGRLDDTLRMKLADSLKSHRQHANGTSLDDLSKALVHDRAFHSALVAAARIPMISEAHARIVGQTHTVFVSIPGITSARSRSIRTLSTRSSQAKKQIVAALKLHLERSRQNTLRQVKVLAQTMEPDLL